MEGLSDSLSPWRARYTWVDWVASEEAKMPLAYPQVGLIVCLFAVRMQRFPFPCFGQNRS